MEGHCRPGKVSCLRLRSSTMAFPGASPMFAPQSDKASVDTFQARLGRGCKHKGAQPECQGDTNALGSLSRSLRFDTLAQKTRLQRLEQTFQCLSLLFKRYRVRLKQLLISYLPIFIEAYRQS